MGDFTEISVDNIIKESRTEKPGRCDKQYIVYLNPDDSHEKIRVNTYYRLQGKTVSLCTYYDRGLCDTLEEYNRLSVDYVERQAYNSWMDGAK